MKPIRALFVFALLSTLAASVSAQPPGGYPQQRGYGYASPPAGFSVQKGVRFERGRDETGYTLRILTRGISPEDIQVSVRGRTLVVQNQESRQVEQRNDRGSYRFSSASSSMRRSFPLPPDADAQAMQRKDGEGMVLITLPYARAVRY